MKDSTSIRHSGSIKFINGSHVGMSFITLFAYSLKGNLGKNFLSQIYYIKSHDYIIECIPLDVVKAGGLY
jgi:hypothetical protein